MKKENKIGIAEFKADFSSILKRVENGETITLTYGRNKKEVAVISPKQQEPKRRTKRQLGILKEFATFEFSRDFKITDDELFTL